MNYDVFTHTSSLISSGTTAFACGALELPLVRAGGVFRGLDPAELSIRHGTPPSSHGGPLVEERCGGEVMFRLLRDRHVAFPGPERWRVNQSRRALQLMILLQKFGTASCSSDPPVTCDCDGVALTCRRLYSVLRGKSPLNRP